MRKVSFSGNEQSIEAIWSWYEDQKEALRDFKYKIINSIKITDITINYDKFFGFTIDEIIEYFMANEMELEHVICFNLISATEAHLYIDFYKKAYKKDKSDLGKIFRKIYNKKGNNISLETDIIENWKEILAEKKNDFSNFLGLLNYRHWLAHCKYWKPKLGQNYIPEITYNIVDNIFKIV